ncbi:hypothetical protein EDB92DRAFT_1849839 [Lactarius akahatsu]|uniref:rRNA-processing protein EFG1 n=1 Tax=Lactarius akahatsu TaxID=416441 RepID=A0AAD4QF09_9AGAM|nr:hypothetical protein EDB92DRAFT_1849839 [Lactarius akahatsu]
MAPIRSKDSQNEDVSTSNQGKIKSRKHKRMQNEDAPLGVSKIKSALRQTRRLLAKEGLAADVRVESERKLKALETDLAAAEKANKERSLATRYHKAKFFDRQKLIRKIKQTKKRLEEDGVSSKVRKALGAELFELRVDLNYVLNYPRLEKYISLFPPDVRTDGGCRSSCSFGWKARVLRTDKRETLREWVRGQMRAGEMASEPETLERKQPAQQSPTGIKPKNLGTKGKGKARQDLEVLDDFFEGEGDSGANGEGTDEEVEERGNVSVPAEVPANRRRDDPTTRLDKDSETVEKHPKKAKHKRHRGQVTTATPIVQDSFFGDDRSD